MVTKMIVIGASLGGQAAVEVLLGALPRDFALPVAIVLHRGPDSRASPVSRLQQCTLLTVCEPEDKEAIAPERVYLAPGGYHLLIDEDHLALSTGAPVLCARPSVDVLFESAADRYAKDVIGVILTGASADGAQGAARIERFGGLVVVQDPKTAEAAAMPKAAIAAAPAARILPIEQIGPFLRRLCAGTRKVARGNRQED